MSAAISQVPELLEKLADFLEEEEAKKEAASREKKASSVAKIQSLYTDATGDELPSDVAAKLAEVDSDILKTLENMASSEKLASMGDASEKTDGPGQPRTIKEAAAQAEDRFAAWILDN